MRVIISDRVVANLPQGVQELHQIFGFLCDGRHHLAFDQDATDPNAPIRRILETYTSPTRELYEEAYFMAAREASDYPADVATVRIDVVETPHWQGLDAVLPLKAALALLKEPLSVLVENDDNDWSFLLGMMKATVPKNIFNRFVEAEKSLWVRPLHGGGSETKRKVKERASVASQCFRTFVVFDSDRRHPDELADDWQPQEFEGCAGYEVQNEVREPLKNRYWMLQRRSIESYMPEVELRNNGASKIANREAIDAFYNMTKAEQWYFNMKRGFKGDDKPENKARRKELYKNADNQALWIGFGRELANHYVFAKQRDFDWDPEARAEVAPVIHRLMRLL